MSYFCVVIIQANILSLKQAIMRRLLRKASALLFAAALLTEVPALAQTKTISGTVTDASGNPLPGVAVVVPGATHGTVTDINGRYSIQVPPETTNLQASFIGYQSGDINLAEGQTDVSLADESVDVDEVIVVAYGTSKKQAFTGSAAVVSADDLSKRTAANVTSTLAGQVPGLQIRGNSGDPGANNGKLMIRGISSLFAATDPLVVVDGAPFDGDLSAIPTGDIESVTILKDAASAALYGARGASGVILITTKKGNSARSEINVDCKWGVNSRGVKDYDVITDPAEYMKAYYTSLYNRYFYEDGLTAAAANKKANNNLNTHLGYQIYTLPTGEGLFQEDGTMNPNASLGYKYTGTDGNVYYITPDDWTDALYSQTPRQEYNVSANGGNEKGNYYTSVGFLKDKGIIEHTDFRRFSARVKADYQIKEWLKVNGNVNYVNSKALRNSGISYSGDGEAESPELSENNAMYFVSSIAPIYPIYVRTIDANGNPVIMKDAYGENLYDFGKGADFGGYAPETGVANFNRSSSFLSGNPIGNNVYNYVETTRNILNSSLGCSFSFLDHFKIDVTSSLIIVGSMFTDYQNSRYGSKKSVGGTVQKVFTNNIRQNHVQTINYFNTFAEVHNLTVMLGHEYHDRRQHQLQADAQGSFSSAIKEINAFAKKVDSKSSETRYNVEGIFGNLQYNYLEKYYAQGSYRRDASSRFAKEHRWGNFWSVGASWMISKEDFMSGLSSIFDELKVKFSIGQQGNDNIGNYAYTDLYNLEKSSDSSMGANFARQGNEKITWETTTNMNTGIEFSLFSRRLSGSFDFYNKKTTDLLFSLNVPESTGTRNYYANIGDIRNRGFELSLNGSVIHTDDLDWSINANIAHNGTEILKLPESKKPQISTASGNVGYGNGFLRYSVWYEEGKGLNNYMTRAYAGVNEKGEALYYYDDELSPAGGKVENNTTSAPAKKKSGVTTEPSYASYYETGSLLPKFYGGFGSTFNWKGIDASVAFDYQIGGKIYDARYASLMSPAAREKNDPGQNYHKDWLRSWSPTNTSSDIPRWQQGDEKSFNASDRFLTNASYLNFSSAVVGYTLPKDLSERIRMNKIRVYASAENITFWSARQGLDPRYSYKETESVSNYSPVRTVSGGIQLQF